MATATSAIPIHTIERRMRGGSQSLFVRDAAGNPYIAKCVGNPQGTRTLINEWIVGKLLKHLRVSTPEVHALKIDRGIPGDELLEFDMGNRKVPIAPGVHFGSRCPVDPEQKTILDFLPRHLIHKVGNLPDLLLAFVFDRWVNQVDTRQAIYIRERSANASGSFRVYLIDHGQSFGGTHWELRDGGLTALHRDRSIYADPAARTECHSAVDRINRLPETSLFSIENDIPDEWFQPGDREEMTRLLELLCGRRTKLHDSIDRALRQMQQAGVAIPKTSAGRRLLGALLLLASLPSPVPFSGLGAIDIEVRASEERLADASAFHFTARSRARQTLNECAIRIWQDDENSYFLRVHTETPGREQLVAEYALVAE
ncbi:MAG TPA: HipA family kinase [Bryobacteraceae bacterium]|nr:HipA family kinase [Bryobacteraceae bacterium]